MRKVAERAEELAAVRGAAQRAEWDPGAVAPALRALAPAGQVLEAERSVVRRALALGPSERTGPLEPVLAQERAPAPEQAPAREPADSRLRARAPHPTREGHRRQMDLLEQSKSRQVDEVSFTPSQLERLA